MPRFPAQIAYLSAVVLIKAIIATPQVAFPINSQLPPVAYASQPFEFTFPPNTFSGAGPDTSYTLVNQPPWLSLNSLTRRLSGTPVSSDLGAPQFALVASDSSGQTSSSVTLVVLEEKRLNTSNGDIIPQLEIAGPISLPNKLVLRPQQPFAFTLPPQIFDGVSTSTTFYATSADQSPLPPWVRFDSTSIRFSGTTPPLLGQNPLQQSYVFSLIASNVVGFSEANVQFTISVTERVLVFTNSSFTFSASPNTQLQVPSLLAQIRINGASVLRDQIVSVLSDPPAWLRLDETELAFNGVPPDNFGSSTFSLVVSGTGTNVANATITIKADARQDASQTDLGSTSAVAGSYFMCIINQPPDFGANVRTTVNSTDLPVWLSFDASNKTLQGFVPDNSSSTVSVIHFTFSNGLRNIVGFFTLTITSLPNVSPIISSTTSSIMMATNSVTSQPTTNNTGEHDKRLLILLLAVLLPVVTLIIAAVVILLCSWRKRKSKEKKHRNVQPQTSPSVLEQRGPSPDENILAKPGSVFPYNEMTETAADLPHADLSWAPDSMKKTRNRFSRKFKTSHGSLVDSSWDDLIDYQADSSENLPPPAPFRVFQRLRKSSTPAAELRTTRVAPRRPSRPDSLILPSPLDQAGGFNARQKQRVGLPKRLSGAGHGAGTGQGLVHSDNRSSWQTTQGSLPLIARRRSTLLMASFPQPPSQNAIEELATAQDDTEKDKRQERTTWGPAGEPGNGSQWRSSAVSAHGGNRTGRQLRSIPRAAFGASGPSQLSMSIPEQEHTNTPPLPQRSQARLSFGHNLSPAHTRASSFSRRPLGRETSLASSHQFDSAMSSDSAWEDESLVAIDNDAERVSAASDVSPVDEPISPLLPSRSEARGNSFSTTGASASASASVSVTQQSQLTYQRELARNDKSCTLSSGQSDQGSFRFI